MHEQKLCFSQKGLFKRLTCFEWKHSFSQTHLRITSNSEAQDILKRGMNFLFFLSEKTNVPDDIVYTYTCIYITVQIPLLL